MPYTNIVFNHTSPIGELPSTVITEKRRKNPIIPTKCLNKIFE
jgi:hypothetical protein